MEGERRNCQSAYSEQFNTNESKIGEKHSIMKTVAQMDGVEPLRAEEHGGLESNNKLSFLSPSIHPFIQTCPLTY